MREQPNIIAVPVLAGMGNGLIAQPLVRRLIEALPGAAVHVLARNASIAGVFEDLPGLANVAVFGNQPRQFVALLRAIRLLRPDWLIVPYPSNRWQYSLLAGASGADRTVLHRYPVGRFRAMHDIGTDRIPAEPGLHDVEQNLRLLRPLGIEAKATPPQFTVPADALEAGEQRLSRSVGSSDDAVAIHAGSGATIFSRSKRWPAAAFGELIEHLRQRGLHPVLLEGPEDAGIADAISAHVDIPVIHLNGPLRDAAAILKACRLYIGSDSGLAHLAAAVGTPPVTLFGPARPDEVCPYGYGHLVVQTPAPCAPCFRYPLYATTPAVRCRPPYCIEQISLGRVLDGVDRALANPAPRYSSKKPASASSGGNGAGESASASADRLVPDPK